MLNRDAQVIRTAFAMTISGHLMLINKIMQHMYNIWYDAVIENKMWVFTPFLLLYAGAVTCGALFIKDAGTLQVIYASMITLFIPCACAAICVTSCIRLRHR